MTKQYLRLTGLIAVTIVTGMAESALAQRPAKTREQPLIGDLDPRLTGERTRGRQPVQSRGLESEGRSHLRCDGASVCSDHGLRAPKICVVFFCCGHHR